MAAGHSTTECMAARSHKTAYIAGGRPGARADALRLQLESDLKHLASEGAETIGCRGRQKMRPAGVMHCGWGNMPKAWVS